MARDFESLIVDPSLVDPGIDTSNLRTTTDTREELLAATPEFTGIQFDPTNINYLDDLYALYSGQLPMIPVTPAATTPAVGSPTSGGGGGGGTPATGSGGQATGSGEQATGGGLTQSGTFGGQPTFTTTPGTTVDNITGDITNPDGTYGGNIVDEFKTTAPQSGFLASGAAGGANLPSISDVKVQGGLSPTEAETLAGYTPSTSITPADTEQTITEKIASFLNVDKNKLNKSAVTSALNLVAGQALNTVIPIASVFNLVKDAFVKSPEEKAAENAAARQNIDEAAAITQRLEKETTPQDIIDDRGRGQIPTKDTKTTVVDRPTMADIAGPSDDKDDGPSTDDFADDFDDGTMTGAAATTTGGDPVGGFFDAVDKAAADARSDAMGGDNTGFSGDTGVGQDAGTSGGTGGRRGGAGGNGGGGGGKIVCTMMNESYGFGSFRNKIWLRHSKDLAPEYQKGYHKIFLPLVKLSKTNKILKKTLEHIAVHRTIDIRQESRGKMHLLGRVYRKILEPICYWVGRHG